MPERVAGSLIEHPVDEQARIAEIQGFGQGPPASPEPPFGEGPSSPEDPQSGIAVGNAHLGLLIFLGAEAMFFAGLIGAFLVFRLGSGTWPPPGQPRLPVGVTMVNTLILLLSAYTMTRALRAIRKGNRQGLAQGLFVTAFLGVTFLAVQGSEWARLIYYGLTLSTGVYGATFYTLIGTHALHVLGAVLWLLIVLIGAGRHRFSAENHIGVQLCGMYWYFVVGLWPVLFTLVYLA